MPLAVTRFLIIGLVRGQATEGAARFVLVPPSTAYVQVGLNIDCRRTGLVGGAKVSRARVSSLRVKWRLSVHAAIPLIVRGPGTSTFDVLCEPPAPGKRLFVLVAWVFLRKAQPRSCARRSSTESRIRQTKVRGKTTNLKSPYASLLQPILPSLVSRSI